MGQRTVKDKNGRIWTCTTNAAPQSSSDAAPMGRDVKLVCTTPSVKEPVVVTVGWGWEKMAENGLARLIAAAA
jgi:hypothetical protein